MNVRYTYVDRPMDSCHDYYIDWPACGRGGTEEENLLLLKEVHKDGVLLVPDDWWPTELCPWPVRDRFHSFKPVFKGDSVVALLLAEDEPGMAENGRR